MPKKKAYDANRAIVLSREAFDGVQEVARLFKIAENEALDRVLGVGIEAVRIGYFAADAFRR